MKLSDLARDTAHGMWDFACNLVAYSLAVVAGVLPRRVWPRLADRIPIWRAATNSGIATILLGAALGIPAYFAYVQGQSSGAVMLMLQATWWVTPPGGKDIPAGAAETNWVAGFFSPFAFAFLTPIGFFTTYLVVTGLLRAVSAYVDDPRGDPILTWVDSIAWKRRQKGAARLVTRAREALEGPEVPDRLVLGRAAGLPDAELVVVASRRKADWTKGTFVVTTDVWYRLGEPVERQLPGGLRTLYPLTEIHDHEALRRAVRYDLPPLSGSMQSSVERTDT